MSVELLHDCYEEHELLCDHRRRRDRLQFIWTPRFRSSRKFGSCSRGVNPPDDSAVIRRTSRSGRDTPAAGSSKAMLVRGSIDTVVTVAARRDRENRLNRRERRSPRGDRSGPRCAR